MQSVGTPVSKKMLWAGWIMSVIPSLMLLMSGGMKFGKSADLIEGMDKMGWDVRLAIPLGIVEIASTLLYLVPQTAVLGAILLTGYMGGAIATHVRIGEPFYVQLILGMALWGGLWLRDPRLWALIPWRK